MKKLNIRKVFCDLDGVILDYVRAYIKWTHPYHTESQIEHLYNQVVEWDGLLKVTKTTMDDLKNIQLNTNFVKTVQRYSYADTYVEMLKETYGVENIAFLTAVTHQEREYLIEKWYPDIPLFSGHRKYFLTEPDYLLIDDSPINCEGWINAGGKAFLYPQPWNIDCELTKNKPEGLIS